MAPTRRASFLLEGVTAVRFGDGIAFLDVDDDSYSCLYGPAGLPGAELPDTRAVATPSFVASSPTTTVAQQWQELPQTSGRVRLRDVRHFVSALTVAAIRFRRRDFAGLLDTHIAVKRTRATDRHDNVADIVTRFESMSLLLPFPMLCLFRSFFLLHFLARQGRSADWVFGITLFPFRAHCWRAIGDTLVGETPQRATQFSPILVLEARGS